MSLRQSRQQGNERRSNLRTRPSLEWLEGRVVLTTFNVNSTSDTVAVDFHNGKDASGQISLRSAIMAADSQGGSSTINLPSGTFALKRGGANEDAGATGDLDLKGNITIKGASAPSTVIDGGSLDRVIDIHSGKVTISNLTIQGGRAVGGSGGGLLNEGATVTLSGVAIQNNEPSEN